MWTWIWCLFGWSRRRKKIEMKARASANSETGLSLYVDRHCYWRYSYQRTDTHTHRHYICFSRFHSPTSSITTAKIVICKYEYWMLCAMRLHYIKLQPTIVSSSNVSLMHTPSPMGLGAASQHDNHVALTRWWSMNEKLTIGESIGRWSTAVDCCYIYSDAGASLQETHSSVEIQVTDHSEWGKRQRKRMRERDSLYFVYARDRYTYILIRNSFCAPFEKSSSAPRTTQNSTILSEFNLSYSFIASTMFVWMAWPIVATQ